MTNREELKPCPFCKNKWQEEFEIEKVTSGVKPRLMFFRVSCSCGASGSLGETVGEARSLWNKRVAQGGE